MHLPVYFYALYYTFVLGTWQLYPYISQNPVLVLVFVLEHFQCTCTCTQVLSRCTCPSTAIVCCVYSHFRLTSDPANHLSPFALALQLDRVSVFGSVFTDVPPLMNIERQRSVYSPACLQSNRTLA